ncbi:MAG: hypothetical protein JWO03_2280 [Bacteroidetes bacterium]|nr:hypothetical protein [Bacteroidota bacterium]
MITSGETEQLKSQLKQATDAAQIDILLVLLEKLVATSDDEARIYTDRLELLVAKTGSILYKSWVLYYNAAIAHMSGDNDLALLLADQALAGFEQMNENPGIMKALKLMGLAYDIMGRYPESMAVRSRYLAVAESTGDKAYIADALIELGNIYYRQDQSTEAYGYYDKALQLARETGDKERIATVYSNKGNCYRKQGRYAEALNDQLSALRLREEIGDQRGMAMSQMNIGLMYETAGHHAEAMENYHGAVRILSQLNDKKSLASTYNNMGNVLSREGKFAEGRKYHQDALRLRIEIGDVMGQSTAYSCLGLGYHHEGLHEKALENMRASLKIDEEIGHAYGAAINLINIANVLLDQGDVPSALTQTNKALEINPDKGDKPFLSGAYESLVSIYKAMGDYASALNYLEMKDEMIKKIQEEQVSKELAQLSLRHELEQQEKELDFEKREKELTQNLLLNILPAKVAAELKEKGSAAARHFGDVTVLFTDFKGFTIVSERLTPQQLVDELHTCFSAFDEIMQKHGIEKIKTVGDAYLAVSGLPQANPNHASDVIRTAIAIRDFMIQRKLETRDLGLETFEIRIGIHSGSVVAGIVGTKKFAYDIWGDTVNTAARMEQNSEAGKINISETTYQLVKDNFTCEYRGEIEAKNKGKLKMYFVR